MDTNSAGGNCTLPVLFPPPGSREGKMARTKKSILCGKVSKLVLCILHWGRRGESRNVGKLMDNYYDL